MTLSLAFIKMLDIRYIPLYTFLFHFQQPK